MLKTKKSLTMNLKGKPKIEKSKGKSSYIPKDFSQVKLLIPKITRQDFNSIVKACQEKPSQDVRLSNKNNSSVKLLNLFYQGIFKGLKGKVVNILKITKGILFSLNASDRKALTCVNILTGNDRIDVVKFYLGTKDCKHPRKALDIRIKG